MLDGLEGAASRIVRSSGSRPDAVGAGQACLPTPRHSRKGTAHVPDALVAVVLARTAVARSDSFADGSAPHGGRPSPAAAKAASAPARHGAGAEAEQGRRPHRGCAAGPPTGRQAAVRARRRFGDTYQPVALGAARVSYADTKLQHQRDERRRRRRADRRWRCRRRLDLRRGPRCRSDGTRHQS